MTIRTRSVFYFVEEITEENFSLNFIEPNADNVELNAKLGIGSYTMSDLAIEVENKLNQTGQVTYNVTFDRDTRIMTIAGDDLFNILASSGSNIGITAWATIGFTTDQTGLSSYNGDSAFGSEYLPQYFLQDYIDKNDNLDNIQSSINESASGDVEVVTFGDLRFYEFNIRWITDTLPKSGSWLEYRENAVQKARDFLTFCIRKQDLEFMPDRDTRGTFDKVILESTRASRNGTGFLLRELTGQGLDEYYETGRLRFRVLL
jgi:hypothetical protein